MKVANNMPDSAKQAKQCARKILKETEKYVSGVNQDGKKSSLSPHRTTDRRTERGNS